MHNSNGEDRALDENLGDSQRYNVLARSYCSCHTCHQAFLPANKSKVEVLEMAAVLIKQIYSIDINSCFTTVVPM